MKLNFWQILGIILIIAGVVFFLRDKTGKDVKPPTDAAPKTQSPATATAPAPNP